MPRGALVASTTVEGPQLRVHAWPARPAANRRKHGKRKRTLFGGARRSGCSICRSDLVATKPPRAIDAERVT